MENIKNVNSNLGCTPLAFKDPITFLRDVILGNLSTPTVTYVTNS